MPSKPNQKYYQNRIFKILSKKPTKPAPNSPPKPHLLKSPSITPPKPHQNPIQNPIKTPIQNPHHQIKIDINVTLLLVCIAWTLLSNSFISSGFFGSIFSGGRTACSFHISIKQIASDDKVFGTKNRETMPTKLSLLSQSNIRICDKIAYKLTNA